MKTTVARMDQVARRLLKARAKLQKVYEEIAQAEEEIFTAMQPVLMVPGFQLKLKTVAVRITSPFIDQKTFAFKRTVHRAKRFNAFEVEVTEL